MKKEILAFANKDKMPTGIIADASKKIGIQPMYLRAGLIGITVFVNPVIAPIGYGAAYAYKRFKK